MLARTASTLRGLFARLRPGSGYEDDAPLDANGSRALDANVLHMLGLERQPFCDNARADELFVDDAVEMQLNMLAQLLRQGDMLPILKGEPGSGKTSLLIQLMARAGDDCHFFVVRCDTGVTAERVITDMLRVLVRPIPDDVGECFRALARRLRDMTGDGRPAALVVDDAHLLADRELGYLLMAHDSLRKALDGHFRLLLAADPGIELRLPALRSQHLDSGQVSAANVRPLGRRRIGPYLRHRLAAAGYRGPSPFDDQALERIHAAGQGLPRGIEAAAAAELNDRRRDW